MTSGELTSASVTSGSVTSGDAPITSGQAVLSTTTSGSDQKSDTNSEGGSRVGPIVGGVLGGIALLGLIATILVLLVTRRGKKIRNIEIV